MTVTGVVTQFKFVKPHALLFMDVTDESGKVSKWVVEFAGRLNLSEIGWTADSIKAKERVTVTGNPTHAAGLPRLAFVKLVKAENTLPWHLGLPLSRKLFGANLMSPPSL